MGNSQADQKISEHFIPNKDRDFTPEFETELKGVISKEVEKILPHLTVPKGRKLQQLSRYSLTWNGKFPEKTDTLLTKICDCKVGGWTVNWKNHAYWVHHKNFAVVCDTYEVGNIGFVCLAPEQIVDRLEQYREAYKLADQKRLEDEEKKRAIGLVRVWNTVYGDVMQEEMKIPEETNTIEPNLVPSLGVFRISQGDKRKELLDERPPEINPDFIEGQEEGRPNQPEKESEKLPVGSVSEGNLL